MESNTVRIGFVVNPAQITEYLAALHDYMRSQITPVVTPCAEAAEAFAEAALALNAALIAHDRALYYRGTAVVPTR